MGSFYPRVLPQCGKLLHVTESLICDQLDVFCTLVTSILDNETHWLQWEEAEISVVGFFSTVGLSDTLCVVGMCFIPAEKPTDVPDPEVHRNAEGLYAVKLLASCNHKGRFTCVWCTIETGTTQKSCQHQRLARHCRNTM